MKKAERKGTFGTGKKGVYQLDMIDRAIADPAGITVSIGLSVKSGKTGAKENRRLQGQATLMGRHRDGEGDN